MTKAINQVRQVAKIKFTASTELWLPTLLILLGGGILAAIIFAVIIYQLIYLDKVYPGVTIGDIDAGGKTSQEITAELAQTAPQYLAETVTIQANSQRWTVSGHDLGVRIEAEKTAAAAFAVGRSDNLSTDLQTQLRLLSHPTQIAPILSYDTGPLNTVLQKIADQVNIPPQDAQLIIHQNGTSEVIPAERGQRLHLEATRAGLTEALQTGNPQPIRAVVQEVIPAITAADVAVAAEQARRLFDGPVSLVFEGDDDTTEWRLSPETLAALVDVTETVDETGQTTLRLEFNRAKLAPHLSKIAETIQLEPADARLKFNTDTNRLEVIEASRQGRALDTDAVYQRLDALLETGTSEPARQIDLPLIFTSPAISSDNLDSLGIKALVSEATSYFAGSSQGRMNNIALSAARFDGVIIPPGETFSFNEHLGEVSKATGFDESLIIYGDRTTVGIGGGVCQVSTTAFRAVLLGGFELQERWAHGYRVGWYETNSVPGLDATIYTPSVDLKFRNDTEYHLLIHTETDLTTGTVTFRFYSTHTGRTIEISQPEITNIVFHDPPRYEKDPTLPKGKVVQVDWSKDGMDVTITRTVTISDSLLHRDVIFSQYKPWQAVYKVGTGESVVSNPQ